MNVIDRITKDQIRTDIPEFRVGDTVRVDVRITEGKRSRIQAFEGLVMSIQGGAVGRRFIVRKVSGGVGVERIFPVNSPIIDKLTVIRKGKVRRAKLNYIRNLRSQPRIKERRDKETNKAA
ncbi:MAG: 50S ribosomal protein L19 [Bacilli bacterium]|nr:50S ribosomal protein L19 [Bacilli bacterium]